MARPTRRESLLANAATLFARRGFAGTSLREVADAASVTKAGIYYHFPEKDDLLHAICAGAIETILEGAKDVLAGRKDARTQLRGLIGNHARYFQEHPDDLAVLNRERDALPPDAREEVRALERRYLAMIREVVRTGQQEGMFRALDPTLAAFTLLAALNTLDRWYDPAGPVSPDRLVAEIETMLLDGLSLPEADKKGDEG